MEENKNNNKGNTEENTEDLETICDKYSKKISLSTPFCFKETDFSNYQIEVNNTSIGGLLKVYTINILKEDKNFFIFPKGFTHNHNFKM